MKNIFVAATRQNDGKTMVSLGMFSEFRKRFSKVAYMKPVGQQYKIVDNEKIDKDAVLMHFTYDLSDKLSDMSPIAVPRGFTSSYIRNGDRSRLVDRVKASYERLSQGKDFLLIEGTVQCLERVSEGYCTHLCGSDADCCAAEGECVSDLPQVCSPFESTGMMMCFLSCEPEDVASTDAADEQAFCQHEVGPAFICRSSGGGSNNRKVCVPGDCGVGSSCAETADCPDDLECNTDYDGGYCGVTGCSANADCPGDSRCVQDGDASYCARPCAADSDCTFCRHPDHPATCTSDVAYAEAGTSGSVCVVG